jgi:hypothetical protein
VVDRDQQVKIVMIDEYWGPPGASPVKNESELAPFKPGTDLVLLGSAYAPGGQPARHFDVTFSVGGRTKNRTFDFREKIDRLFLHTIDWDQENGKWASKIWPKDGFCFFPKQLSPRLNYAGTYDENWRKSRCPFLPEDFDYRFFQAAYPDLICEPYVHGNERLQAIGVSCGPPIITALPDLGVEVEAFIKKKRVAATANLDTVIVEADIRRLILLWRSMFQVNGAPSDVQGFVVKSTSLSRR